MHLVNKYRYYPTGVCVYFILTSSVKYFYSMSCMFRTKQINNNTIGRPCYWGLHHQTNAPICQIARVLLSVRRKPRVTMFYSTCHSWILVILV